MATMLSRMATPMATGRLNASAATPATSNARRISSVAYALELMASELNMASALVLDKRSPISSSLARGRPMSTRRTRSMARPSGVVGALAAGLAVRTPLPVYRK